MKKKETTNDQITHLQNEEQELIKFCAKYIHAIQQPQSCKDLGQELKDKVQMESQQLQEKFGY